ncbi:MAG: DUF3332 domain-containing protein, partial [Chitinispirillales bacterium]|jgi:hypothetical protein|nr:DUF3332 domain-containing protein [Chitinispirillales bacterium]
VLAAFTCVSLSGCYGSYALFNKVQSWNGSIGDKWVNSVVNFVFWIIPVYGISLLADFFILNTIEFWVGSNPVAMGDTYEETDGNGNKIYAVKNSDGTLSVNIVGANGSKADFILERDGDIIRAIDIGGALIAQRIINAEGVLVAQK